MHVLIATDSSSSARAALRFAARALLRSMSVHQITLLTVMQPSYAVWFDSALELVPQTTWDEVELAEVEAAQQTLEQSSVVLNGFAGHVSTAVRKGRRAAEIVRAARELDADLVVLGYDVTSYWDKLCALVFGSVVREVLDSAPCPVIVVPSGYAGATRTSYVGIGDWSAAA
jgi:nucleotide-binding universal stress UspA family protein